MPAGGRGEARPARRFDRTSLLLGSLAALLVLLMAEVEAGFRASANEPVFDQFQRWKPRPYDPELPIRIVDIDRESLDRYGQWPWPRTVLGAMVDRLGRAGAAVVAFDMVFAEPDRTSPEVARLVAEAAERSGAVPETGQLGTTLHDRTFAEALGRAGTVLGALISSEPTGEAYRGKAGFSIAGPDPGEAIARVAGLEMPVEALAEAAAGIGAVGFGAIGAGAAGLAARQVPMVLVHRDAKVPALALETLRVAVDARGYLLKSTGASGERGAGGAPEVVGVRVGPFEVPLSPGGGLRVRYAGHQPARIIPAWRVLSETAPVAPWAGEVAGRIILVGSSAPGISQAVDTPIAAAQLGVEVSAEVIEQILTSDYLLRPYWAPGAERLMILVFGLLVTLVMATGNPVGGAVAMLAGVGVAALASWAAFDEHGLLLGPVYPALGSFVPFALLGAVNYARTDAEKRAIRHQFEHFLAPEVIAEIARDPSRYLTPGGEEREVAILFCDIRGFSTVTEGMPPQQVIRFVNRFLTPVSEAIIAHGGTIDKYMGDAIMAFWNAPRQTPDYRAQAVRGLFAMRRTVDGLNRSARPRGEPEIRIGIGLNNGPCSVGFMGSERRLEYSCIGDAVNLASRFEGLTKQYGVWNCVGAGALEGVAGVLATELDLVVVKGFTRPASVWTVLADEKPPPALAEAVATLEGARAAFLARHWDAAEEAFHRLSAMQAPGFEPSQIAANYLARIAQYRETPPPEDWTGAYVALEK